MTPFNPYLVDEIVTEAKRNLFGLIDDTEANSGELYGYEVTMSGRLVIPEFRLQPAQTDAENQTASGQTYNECTETTLA
jgi:hypothetical protein